MKLTRLIFVLITCFSLTACDKIQSFFPSSTLKLAQKIWDEDLLGVQVQYLEKKFDITPKQKFESGKDINLTYEIDNKEYCYLKITADKKTQSIHRAEINSSCKIHDHGHGTAPEVDFSDKSKSSFKYIVKQASGRISKFSQDCSPCMEDCLTCGNAYEPLAYVTFDGFHANNFITVKYTFSYNDGIYNWIDKINKKTNSKASFFIDDKISSYKMRTEFNSLAIAEWHDEVPYSIILTYGD